MQALKIFYPGKIFFMQPIKKKIVQATSLHKTHLEKKNNYTTHF